MAAVAMARNGHINTVAKSRQPWLMMSHTDYWVSRFRGCLLTWGGGGGVQGRESDGDGDGKGTGREGKEREHMCVQVLSVSGYMLQNLRYSEIVQNS